MIDYIISQFQTIYATLQNLTVAISTIQRDANTVFSDFVDPNGTN